MLTPQEVSSHAFTKGFMGGYNMAMVDEFLDELTDDYTALYKENAALKAKLKVLVEKVEEYRATEDSMRATLLTAQKMADSIVREAEARRDNLLAQAEADARERIAQIQREVETSEKRLHRGQQELASFIAAAQRVCSQELKLLEELPELPAEALAAAEPALEARETQAAAPVTPAAPAAPAAAPAAAAPAAPAAAAASPAAESAAAAVIPPAAPAAPVTAEPPAAADPYPEGDPFVDPFAKEAPESLEPTRRIRFDKLDELKFGTNYTSGT